MMKAPQPPSLRKVELDSTSNILGRYFQVSFALLFPGSSASPEQLSAAFGKMLPSVEVLAGRLVLAGAPGPGGTPGGEKLAILCNNAGVPLTVGGLPGAAPSFARPIPAGLFDLEKNYVPAGVEDEENGAMGGALLRIKVTNFDNAQVMAVSMCHGLCDAAGIGLFMSAWADAFRGGPGTVTVSHDRIAAAVPAPAYGSPALISATEGDVPAEWLARRHTEANCPRMPPGPLSSLTYACAQWSSERCAALKARSLELCSGVSFVSSNDAVCAAVAAALSSTYEADADQAGFKGALVPLSMVTDIRAAVGANSPPCFGNLFSSLEILVQPSPVRKHSRAQLTKARSTDKRAPHSRGRCPQAGAGDVRQALATGMDGGFIRWNAAQGINTEFGAKLMMNSWTKALRLEDLTFAGPAGAAMLGAPMMAERASMMAPQGINYCIVLPGDATCGGVKVVAVMAEAVTMALQESGAEVTITGTECDGHL
jgi:hypothetical protein